ncbi:MAG: hypothetical protein ACLTEH_00755 [Clostridia bacterium]
MPPSLGRGNSTTGVFPQVYLSQRTIALPNERFNLAIKQWTANITGGNILCADQNAALRSGRFDTTTYYGSRDTLTSIPELVQEQYYWTEMLIPDGGEKTGESYSVSGDINQYENVLNTLYYEASSDYLNDLAKSAMEKVMGILSGQEKMPPYSTDIDPVNTYGDWDGDPNLGPKVGVMETGTRAGNGYEKVVSNAIYAASNGGGVEAQVAYVLSALEDSYGQGEFSKEYTEEDLQTAYWMLVDPDGKDSLIQSHLTAKGKELYQKSVEYVNFLQEISGGYKPTIDDTEAQVIANQNSREYIVGPFKANYPDYEDISYMKSMYITNGSKKLVVDEENEQFEIICKGNETTVPGSNGISKIYPKSGEYFFIKFSASELNYQQG